METHLTDKAIADHLVEAGILLRSPRGDYYRAFSEPRMGANAGPMTAAQAVRDWRVAGACLERAYSFRFDHGTDTTGRVAVKLDNAVTRGTELPRAICLAFVESRRGQIPNQPTEANQ